MGRGCLAGFLAADPGLCAPPTGSRRSRKARVLVRAPSLLPERLERADSRSCRIILLSLMDAGCTSETACHAPPAFWPPSRNPRQIRGHSGKVPAATFLPTLRESRPAGPGLQSSLRGPRELVSFQPSLHLPTSTMVALLVYGNGSLDQKVSSEEFPREFGVALGLCRPPQSHQARRSV